MNPMNPPATRIQWINLNPDYQDSRFLCFFGKGFENSPCGMRSSHENTVWTCLLSIVEKIPFRIFRFFGRKESAINPFLDFLFLLQKRIRVTSRSNPILDFAKEMHNSFGQITQATQVLLDFVCFFTTKDCLGCFQQRLNSF